MKSDALICFVESAATNQVLYGLQTAALSNLRDAKYKRAGSASLRSDRFELGS